MSDFFLFSFTFWKKSFGSYRSPEDHDLSGGQLSRPGSEDNLEETEKSSSSPRKCNIGTFCSSVFTCQALDSLFNPISTSLPLCSFLPEFFLSVFLLLFSNLTLPFRIFSVVSIYFFLPLFNVNTFKLYPSKRASLNNIVSTFVVYPRPAFIPGLFCFTYSAFFFFLIFIQQSSSHVV